MKWGDVGSGTTPLNVTDAWIEGGCAGVLALLSSKVPALLGTCPGGGVGQILGYTVNCGNSVPENGRWGAQTAPNSETHNLPGPTGVTVTVTFWLACP
jgi:hypothetical protein